MSLMNGARRLEALSQVGRGGGSLGMGSGGVEVPPPMPSLQIKPWWEQPFPSSQYIYVDTFAATGAAQVVPSLAQSVLMVGSEYQVPSGDNAVISAVSLLVQSSLATDNYFFTMLRNGSPVQGLDRLRNFSIAANGAVREYAGYAVKLEPNDIVQWTVTNNGGAAVSVSVSYQGWTAAKAEIERIQGGLTV